MDDDTVENVLIADLQHNTMSLGYVLGAAATLAMEDSSLAIENSCVLRNRVINAEIFTARQ